MQAPLSAVEPGDDPDREVPAPTSCVTAVHCVRKKVLPSQAPASPANPSSVAQDCSGEQTGSLRLLGMKNGWAPDAVLTNLSFAFYCSHTKFRVCTMKMPISSILERAQPFFPLWVAIPSYVLWELWSFAFCPQYLSFALVIFISFSRLCPGLINSLFHH